MNTESSKIIKVLAPSILSEVKKAKSILLHCHPSPDPDSVGSALAMMHVLEGMGKKVTVIQGDSDIPDAFMHFPGASQIVKKSYGEVDHAKYDLFIAVDSASKYLISRKSEAVFPPHMTVVVIDHHPTNTQYGKINLVEPTYPATAQVLYDLFKEWKVKIDSNVAQNLFIGIYTDTGGFKYPGVTNRTYEIAADLVSYTPDLPGLVSGVENSNSPAFVRFEGLALNAVQTFCHDRVAVSIVSNQQLLSANIPANETKPSEVASFMRTVKVWEVLVAGVEIEPNVIKFSFRSRDEKRFDVSKLAMAMSTSGGGHKQAAGCIVNMTIDEAKKLVVAKSKELYNL